LGYYLNIKLCDLRPPSNKVRRLINSIKGLNKLEYFEYSHNQINPKEYWFKASEHFTDELVKMSRAGVEGVLVLVGEDCVNFKYELDGKGKVKVYDQKEIIFSSKPISILEG